MLVVDDAVVYRRAVSRFAQVLGWKVDAVCNGLEAVAAASQHRYDVILMDCQMPVMDGLEATRAIRSQGEGQPVIVGVSATADAGECLQAGMNHFVGKLTAAEQLKTLLIQLALSEENV